MLVRWWNDDNDMLGDDDNDDDITLRCRTPTCMRKDMRNSRQLGATPVGYGVNICEEHI